MSRGCSPKGSVSRPTARAAPSSTTTSCGAWRTAGALPTGKSERGARRFTTERAGRKKERDREQPSGRHVTGAQPALPIPSPVAQRLRGSFPVIVRNGDEHGAPAITELLQNGVAGIGRSGLHG